MIQLECKEGEAPDLDSKRHTEKCFIAEQPGLLRQVIFSVYQHDFTLRAGHHSSLRAAILFRDPGADTVMLNAVHLSSVKRSHRFIFE